MIRPAELEDLPYIVKAGRAFHGASPLSDVSEFDATYFERTMAGYIENTGPFEAGVFVWGQEPLGVIAGLVYPAWFNGQTTGQDLFWWLDQDARSFPTAVMMLDCLEAWAHANNALWFTMAATETMRPGAVEALYRRRGYVQSERHFIRRL